MVVKKLLALILIISLAWVPWAQATMVATDTGRYVLTPSGVTKVEAAVKTVSRGLGVARALGFLSGPVLVGLAVIDVASTVWDWVSRYFEDQSSYDALPSQYLAGSCWTPSGSYVVHSTSGRCATPGWNGTAAKWTNGNFTCGTDGTAITYLGAGYQVIGSALTYYTSGACTYWHAQIYYEATSTVESRNPVLVDNPQTAPSDKNASVIAALEAAKAALEASSTRDALGNAIPSSGTRGEAVSKPVDVLREAIDLLRFGVPLTPGTDYTPGSNFGDPQGPRPLMGPGGAAATSPTVDLGPTNAKLDQIKDSLNAAAAPAPQLQCATCTRVETWTTMMQSWQSAAAGAPIFALISNLAWPGTGTVQRQWTVGSWRGTELTIDLDDSGIGTVITVVRFVVIGGAVIIAYMIIFA